jgi:hypothetical protein
VIVSGSQPYAAYLRVYEPLAAFPEPERSRLAAVPADESTTREAVLAAERVAALRRVTGRAPGLVPGDEPDEAYVLRTRRGLLYCPRQDRLRSWVALAEFVGELPEHVVGRLLPTHVIGDVDRAYASWRDTNPGAVPRILTATWHVPARWFVVVDYTERELDLTPLRRSLVYRTTMADARRRTARALRVLRKAFGEDGVAVHVEEIGRWLESFHPHSVVELDYGGLVDLLSDEALADDDSPREVVAALSALAADDQERAEEAYARLVARWEVVLALEHAS